MFYGTQTHPVIKSLRRTHPRHPYTCPSLSPKMDGEEDFSVTVVVHTFVHPGHSRPSELNKGFFF